MVIFNVYLLLQTVAVTLSTTVTAETSSVKLRHIRSNRDYVNSKQMDGHADTNDNNAISAKDGVKNPTSVEFLRPCAGWSGSTLLGYAPGSMESYALAASLTIHACLVVYHCSVRAVSVVSARLSERSNFALTVRNLSEDHPWIIGKL